MPLSICLTIRALYTLGWAEEFAGPLPKSEYKVDPLTHETYNPRAFRKARYTQVNAIWDSNGPEGGNPPASKCLDLLTTTDTTLSGNFYAVDVETIPEEWRTEGIRDYAKESLFLDFTALWAADGAVGEA